MKRNNNYSNHWQTPWQRAQIEANKSTIKDPLDRFFLALAIEDDEYSDAHESENTLKLSCSMRVK